MEEYLKTQLQLYSVLTGIIVFLIGLAQVLITTFFTKRVESKFNHELELLKNRLDTSKHISIKRIDDEIALISEIKHLYFKWIESLLDTNLDKYMVSVQYAIEFCIDKNKYLDDLNMEYRMKLSTAEKSIKDCETSFSISVRKISFLSNDLELINLAKDLHFQTRIMALPIKDYIFNLLYFSQKLKEIVDEMDLDFRKENVLEELSKSKNIFREGFEKGADNVKPFFKVFNNHCNSYISKFSRADEAID